MNLKCLVTAAALVAGTALTAGGASAATAGTGAYPGKNGLIAFVRANQIYTISPSGTGLKKLTTSGKNYNPVWNPAGTEIAFEHEYPAGTRNIWVMNANGSSKRQWTNTGTTFGSPAWSPDGKTLLFTNGGQWGALETTSGAKPLQPAKPLYGYNQDWQACNCVSNYTILYGHNPTWKSGSIVFTATQSDGAGYPGPGKMCDIGQGSSNDAEYNCIEQYLTGTQQFWIMSAHTEGYLATDACIDNNLNAIDWPRWSPGGTALLFEFQPVDNNCNPLPWQVDTLAGGLSTQPGDQQADYSPDGTYIVLANALPGQTANIIIESTTGTNRKTLTQGYQPNWQPIP